MFQVLVMGANEEEEIYFTKRLEADDVKLLPKKVTTEYSIPDRQKLYLEGGVLFITTRIMVVDMLTDRMPMCKNMSRYPSHLFNLRLNCHMYTEKPIFYLVKRNL
jgi:hypothetical protein